MKYAVYSDKGGRENNEDSVKIFQNGSRSIFVLADGLGGHGFGEVASETAVETLCNEAANAAQFNAQSAAACIAKANEAILAKQSKTLKYRSMRSTIATVFIEQDCIIAANVGDSRIYAFAAGKVRFVSSDHSVAAALVRIGEISAGDVRFHQDRNRLTKVLGQSDETEPSVYELSDCGANAILLCSDGFWEYIEDEEMAVDLAKSETPKDWLEYMLVRILNRVSFEHDNISAVTIML